MDRPEIEGLARPLAQPHVVSFDQCFDDSRPWNYDSKANENHRLLIDKVGKLTIMPYCAVRGTQPYRSLSVIPADWVYSRIAENMINIDDRVTFELIGHDNGWALLVAHYNKILGSAWLAYIRTDSIPSFNHQ